MSFSSIDEAFVERFVSTVDRSGGPDACWPWTGYRNSKGYGWVNWSKGHNTSAARIAFFLATDTEPAVGALIMHSCDNPPCCNPSHLRIGSASENSSDMINKGRSAWGERHSQAKLTNEQVLCILRRLPTESNKSIALSFGVDHTAVSKIRRGIRWRRITAQVVSDVAQTADAVNDVRRGR